MHVALLHQTSLEAEIEAEAAAMAEVVAAGMSSTVGCARWLDVAMSRRIWESPLRER